MNLSIHLAPGTTATMPVSFRVCIQSRLALMQARLQEVNNLVKLKNPSLLLQLQTR